MESQSIPEDISCDFENRIIRFKPTGYVPISAWYDSLKAVMNLNSKHGIDSILLDTTQQTKTSDHREFAQFSKSLPKALKIALLVRHASEQQPATTEPEMRFLEVAASINDIKIKSFIEEVIAINWLKSSNTMESA